MNKRIAELASQAYGVCKKINDEGQEVVLTDEWNQKFAELIIQECDKVQSELLAIAILDKWDDELCADNIKRTARYLQSNSFAKHFRVKE